MVQLLVLAVFLAAGLTIYFPSLKAGPVFDDLHTVEQNPALRSIELKKFFTDPRAFSSKPGNWPYRPVTVLSYAVDWKIGAGSFQPFHLTNICLHCLAAFLLYLAAVMLFQNRRAALIAGMLFLVHPLPGFSVNYLSARSGILSGMFSAASLVSWLKYNRQRQGPKWIWLAASLGFFLLALFSKIDAASLVLVIACWLFFSGLETRQKLLRAIPFFVLAAVFIVFYKFVSGSLLGAVQDNMIPVHSRGTSVLAGISSPWIYLIKMFYPWHLTIFPALPKPEWLLLMLSLTGYILVLLTAARWRTLKLWLPLVWYFGAVLPLALMRLNILLAWHRGYISLLGLCLGAGLALDFLVRKTKVMGIVFLFLLALLLAATSNFQSRTWQDPVRLWTEAVTYAPDEHVPHHFLGTLLIGRGETAQAEKELLTVIKLDPEFVDARNSLGALYFQEGELFRARDQFEECVRLDPENYIYLENLLIVRLKLLQIGGLDKMIERLLQIAPADDPKLLQIIDRYEELRAATGDDFTPEE